MPADITPDLINAYINGKTAYPTNPSALGEVVAACTPEQRAKLRRRVSLEMSLAEFGDLWPKVVRHADRILCRSCAPSASIGSRWSAA